MVIPLHDDNPTSRTPVVTFAIIAICIAVFALIQPRGGQAEAEFTYERAAIPCELKQGRPLEIVEINRADCTTELASPEPFPDKNVWLAVLVSMFLHGSWFHVLGNMLFLWIFGNNIEDHLGKIGFVIFYVLAGAVAMGAHYLADPGSTTPVVGASGAIAGVMGMYLVLWPRARVMSLVPFLLVFVVAIPAFAVLGLWFGLQFLTDPNSSVAWVAHVGGFLAGVGVGVLVRAVKPPRPVGVPS